MFSRSDSSMRLGLFPATSEYCFADRLGENMVVLSGGGLGGVRQRRRGQDRGQFAGQDIKERSAGHVELQITPGVQAEAPEWQ
ncbi:MAG: hypothetical protein ABI742_13265 [Gemmatimonadota bacterium]